MIQQQAVIGAFDVQKQNVVIARLAAAIPFLCWQPGKTANTFEGYVSITGSTQAGANQGDWMLKRLKIITLQIDKNNKLVAGI